MDDGDRARERADELIDDALGAHYRRVDEIRSLHATHDCQDCGEEIPERRRQAVPSCSRCIDCQREFEIFSRGIK